MGGSEMIITTKCKPKYTVRKLTPTECARLQGFPDWWCDDIENTNPSEEDMEFWRSVFKTYYTINGKKTVKTDKQIVKWLSSDNGDSARYKMWGNGVALPNVIFVLSGIAEGSENGKGNCESELEWWFSEYPEAVPIVKELQDRVKAEKPKNHTPLRNQKWFIE